MKIIGRKIAWRVRYRLKKPAIVDIPSYSAKLYLPAWRTGFPKQRYIYRERIKPDPELTWLVNHLQPGDVVADIGAHLGDWAVMLAKRVGPEGRVLCVEPSPETFQALRKTVMANDFANCILNQVALSDREGVVRLYLHGQDPDRNTLAARWGQYVEVPTKTMDALLRQLGVRQLDALKVDVEGAEELVFRGAVQSLSTWRPAVIFEVNPRATQALGLEPDGAWRLLQKLGYQFHEIDENSDLKHVSSFSSIKFKGNFRNIIALCPHLPGNEANANSRGND